MPYFFLFACIAAVAILLYLTFFFFRIIVFLVGKKYRLHSEMILGVYKYYIYRSQTTK